MDIYFKSRDGKFDATGFTDGNIFVVKKGSIINLELGASSSKTLKEIRNRDGILDENGVLVVDVEFNSASTAGQFVCGHSTNGMRSWKDKNGESISKTIKGKGRKPVKFTDDENL